MTCAGMLAMALGHASDPARAKQDLSQDKQVVAALTAVASTIGNPVGDRSKVPSVTREKQGRLYYTLWSLERMAVVYGLEDKKIAGKDWFGWGAELLLANQSGDGSWQGVYGEGGCDTCFALLFLKRANVAADLTAKVKVKPPEVKSDARLVIPDLPNIVGKDDPGKGTVTKDPPKQSEPDARALGAALVDAPPAKQADLLKKLRDGRGDGYTLALADTIPKLKGEIKTRTRVALAERLAAGTGADLAAGLKSPNVEVRHAAAEAAGQKKGKEHLPELINLLEDGETFVARAAQRALLAITGQDFGPEKDATRADWTATADAWRNWLKKQK